MKKLAISCICGGGGDSKPSVKGLSAYTLAEVVVVMLIIAAIVAVSIRGEYPNYQIKAG